jgi:phage-related protein
MKQKEYQREVIVYKDFFWEFYTKLNSDAQNKIEWTLGLVRDLPVVPAKYFKSIQGASGLFEIRVQFGNDNYRIFCCFNSRNGLVLLNGFIKKSNRTPRGEIVKAIKIKKEYSNEREY